MSQSKRIVYLDVFRFLMVAVALLSHVFLHFGTWNVLSDEVRLPLRALSRGATPGLLILFGFMLEFVYVKYARRQGLGFSLQRMTYRAILCYMAFAIIVLAGVIGGNLAPVTSVATLLLLAPYANAGIFAIYMLVLFAIMPIIALRLRFGINVLFGVLALIWTLDVLIIQPLPNPFSGSLDNIGYFSDLMIGLGDERGPSIFHGLTAVLFGMILGNTFVERSKQAISRLLIPIGIALTVLTLEISQVGWYTFFTNIYEYKAYRANNSIIYYSYGIAYAMGLMGIAWTVNRIIPQFIRAPIAYLGTRTFLYFFFGNLLLSLIPEGYVVSSPVLGFAIFIALTTVTYLMIKLWEARFHGWSPVIRARESMVSGSTKLIDFVARKQPSLAAQPSQSAK